MIQSTSDYSGVIWKKLNSPSSSELRFHDASVVFISRFFRLENHDDLADQLGLRRDCTTEAVLIEGWRHWHEELPTNLRGSFSFAIFDHGRQALFAARDSLGEAPLYYLARVDMVVAADTSRIVRDLANLDLSIDLPACADFLNGGYGGRESTFFSGMRRLPAGSWVLFPAKSGAVHRRFWAADMSHAAPAPTLDTETGVQAFRKAFDRAVMARYQAGQTAILLSGGLDSSAILGSLIDQGISPSNIPCLVKTYRLSPNWRDEPYLASLQRKFGLTYHEVASDQHNPLQDMDMWLEVLDGPYVSYGHSVASHLLFEAKRAGWSKLLSGHGGDEVVGYGLGRLNELARQRRLLLLWQETAGMAALSGQSRLRLMRKYMTHNALYRRVERRILRFFPDPVESEEASLNEDAHEALPEYGFRKIPAMLRKDHDDRMVHIEALEDPVQQLALETIGQSSRSLGLETSMPFYDRDLIELSLSLPSSLKLRGGMTRFVLRAAMRGRLPADVLARQDKYDFTGPFIAGLAAHREEVLDLTQVHEGNLLFDLVNKARLERVRGEMARTGTLAHREDARFIWRCSILAIWQGQLARASGSPSLSNETGQS